MEKGMGAKRQDPARIRKRNAGFAAFFISGICAISCGVVVSLLQERLGFDYAMTGTLLSMMNIGNLAAAFLAGKIGMKKSVMLLTIGYAAGYLIMASSGWIALLMAAFFLAGIGKGSTINTCTILVGDNSENRTRGMNIMHGCYAFGALLCPFLISAAGLISPVFPMAALGVCGLILWLIFAAAPMEEKEKEKKKGTDWSFLKSRKFWILTGLLFCQNGAETSVTGWLVTYFKGSGILTGNLSTYTVTVMWLATLAARMLSYTEGGKGHDPHVHRLHRLLFWPYAGGKPVAGYSPSFCFCCVHGGNESHCCGMRRTDDQRGQHGDHASCSQQRRDPHALGYRAGGGTCGDWHRYVLQHASLWGNADLQHAGKKRTRKSEIKIVQNAQR